MRMDILIVGLLATLLFSSCAPTATVEPPQHSPASDAGKTVVAEPTSSLIPIASATQIPPTVTPENLTPTPIPTIPLSTNGPWLLYVHNIPSLGVADTPEIRAEFVVMNQDGVGRASITLPDCRREAVDHFLLDGQNAINYRAYYDGSSYLFRPADATGIRADGFGWYHYPACDTFSNGDKTNELLASIYRAEDQDVPELMIYELPSGKIRDRIALVKCAKEATACEKNRLGWHNMEEQRPEWSPNGRYLAFSAVLDSASSDLFLYDAKDGRLRRLTNGPDWVGVIQWSPDGTQIIMNEIPNYEDGFFPRPSIVGDPPKSLWSVSVTNNEIKLLYPIQGANQNILRWLDDKRFFAYEGALTALDNGWNLRLVDTDTDTAKILFNDPFTAQSFDPIHEIFMLYSLGTNSDPDSSGFFLVSAKNATRRHLGDISGVYTLPQWDEKTGLFVSEYPCENDPQSWQAFDYLGNLKCIPKSRSTPTAILGSEATHYPAPNGQFVISVKDGVWLAAQGQAAVQVSAEIASEVIWCPNSACFFFLAPQQNHTWNLYRISVPDLTLKMVDSGIESVGSMQWLENNP